MLLFVVICLHEMRQAISGDPAHSSLGMLAIVTVFFFLLGVFAAFIAHRINKKNLPSPQE